MKKDMGGVWYERGGRLEGVWAKYGRKENGGRDERSLFTLAVIVADTSHSDILSVPFRHFESYLNYIL